MKLVVVLALVACSGSGAPPPRESPRAPPARFAQINKPGELVDIEATIPAGYVAVIDFWGEHCGACEVVGRMLDRETANDERIVIRKVDVGDGFTPVAQHYKIGALPHFRIYDKQKRVRYVLVGNDTTKAGALAKQLAAESGRR